MQNPPAANAPKSNQKSVKVEPHSFPNQQQGMYNHNPNGMVTYLLIFILIQTILLNKTQVSFDTIQNIFHHFC